MIHIFQLIIVPLQFNWWTITDLSLRGGVDIFHFVVNFLEKGEFLVIGFFLYPITLGLFLFEALHDDFFDVFVHLYWAGYFRHFSEHVCVLIVNFEGYDVVGAVTEICYLQATLELLHAFLVLLVFEEK